MVSFGSAWLLGSLLMLLCLIQPSVGVCCLFPTTLPNITLHISVWYVEPNFCEICLGWWDKLSRQLVRKHALVFIHKYLFNNVRIFTIINVFVISLLYAWHLLL